MENKTIIGTYIDANDKVALNKLKELGYTHKEVFERILEEESTIFFISNDNTYYGCAGNTKPYTKSRDKISYDNKKNKWIILKKAEEN